jgi:hypothetical protein
VPWRKPIPKIEQESVPAGALEIARWQNFQDPFQGALNRNTAENREICSNRHRGAKKPVALPAEGTPQPGEKNNKT